MKVWKLKSCPRCAGDIFLDRDEEHRWYEQCLQCGHVRELTDINDFGKSFSEKAQESFPQPVLINGRRARGGSHRRI